MEVSIGLITFNHEQYIAESLTSVLEQETSFRFKLIIGEDCSTDNTRKICEGFAAKYPDIITLLPAEKNLGMMNNFLRTLKACNGNYIAIVEGDDYWTDKKKLQKQIDFLSSNSNYSACFHNALMKEERNNEKKEWVLHKTLPKDNFDTEDILGPWFIATCSFVFVNYPDFILPEWFSNCKYGDLPFMLLLSLRGKFKYIDEVMSVYRLHDTGLTTVHKAYDKIALMIYIYESFNIHTNYKYQDTIRRSIIYEIDRHIPKKDLPVFVSSSRNIFSRSIRKIKKTISFNK